MCDSLCGRAQKKGRPAIGRSRGGWTTKRHALVANERTALILALSPGQAGDAPWGRTLLRQLGPQSGQPALIMDRAYEADETRALAQPFGFRPVVPPKANRFDPWDYDHELYRRRNEVERFFRWLKGFRRIATRYDKLDVIFLAFIQVALIFDALQLLCTGPSQRRR